MSPGPDMEVQGCPSQERDIRGEDHVQSCFPGDQPVVQGDLTGDLSLGKDMALSRSSSYSG